MSKNKNNSQQIIINENIFKNIDSLTKKLSSSLNLQKKFIKDIHNLFQKNNIENEVQNKKEISLVNKIVENLPELIKQLGIPFSYYLLTEKNMIIILINMFFERNDEKIGKIFEKSLDCFSFTFIFDDANKLKSQLIEVEILKKEEYDNPNFIMKKSEHYIFDETLKLLNELKKLENTDIDIIYISKLEKEYYKIISDIGKLPNSQTHVTQAQIDFYLELVKPVGDYLNKFKNNKNDNNKFGTNNPKIKESKSKNDKIIGINNDKDEENEEIQNYSKEVIDIMNKPLNERTFFYRNEKIKEKRSQLIEFKNYSIPLNQENGEDLKQQMCGFLNSQGGRLYIGINDQNIVKGIVLNYKKRDNLRNSLINLTYDFYPKCRLDKFFIYFIPIKNMKDQDFVPNLYVIKIRIYPGNKDKLYSMINVGYQSTIRKEGKCIELNSNEIYEEIIRRDEDKSNNQEEKDINIKDPEPEVNQQDLENNDDDDNNPTFGNENLNNSIKKIIKEKGQNSKKKKLIKNMVREGTIVVKVSNIDENVALNDVNRFFNKSRCASQKFFNEGYGYLNFSSLNDANNCIANYNGKKIGNKKIKLKIMNDEIKV